jgi:hypothetical protein
MGGFKKNPDGMGTWAGIWGRNGLRCEEVFGLCEG